MSKELTIYHQIEGIQKAADALYKSGYFKDVTSQAQAIVKVLAGAELGLPPFASMTGINIIQGKPTIGANLIATLVKNDPRYDYQVKKIDNDSCVLEWYEGGKVVGTSSFTMQEAKTAGLAGKDNWTKYPSDMLFARSITRGVRRYAPGVFGGAPVYTPEELGADTDEDGNIVTVQATEVHSNEAEIMGKLGYASEPPKQQPAQQQPVTNGGARPYPPEVLQRKLVDHSIRLSSTGATAQHSDRNILASVLDTTVDGDKDKRHALLAYLTGFASTKDLPDNMVVALMKWLDIENFGDKPHPESVIEAKAAYLQAIKEQGQLELPISDEQLP